jgi:ABC-type transport system substrate-binding protein
MKTKHLAAITLVILSVALGAITFAQPPGFQLESERGTWSDEHWRTLVIGAEAQMVTLLNHDVDAGGPPTPDDIEILEAAGYTMASTGGFSHYWYALNNRVEPLDDVNFRMALAYCMNKDEIYPDLYGPLVTPIYNWAPPAQAFWCDPYVDLNFPRFDLDMAIQTLIGGGYTPVLIDGGGVAEPGNIDYWYMPGTTTPIRDLEQGVPNTSTLGMLVSEWIETDLHSIGLPIYHTPLPFGYIVYEQWLAPPYLSWDCTIGIGLIFGVDPVLDVMYHVDAIPFANIWGLDDSIVNDEIDAMMATLDWDTAQEHAFNAERRLLELMPLIPMITSQTWTCCTGPYDGQPGVLGFVNMEGYGGLRSANDWCRLYSRREDESGDPLAIQNWLTGQDADILNPLTSDTAYEWNLMGPTITGMYIRHPYTHQLLPWSAADYPEIQLWNGTHRTYGTTDPIEDRPWMVDPSPIGTPGTVTGEYMKWTLRSEMTWHDGTPVTAEDCEFVIDLLINQNNERYESTHKYIHDVNIPDPTGDPLTYEIYYTARYLWADNDAGGLGLLAPKHIWKPYIQGPDETLWTGDDLDHRFWTGHDWTDMYGYSAPIIDTAVGSVQLTHLQGNGYNVYPLGGWDQGVSMHTVRWNSTNPGWTYTRILRGDNNFDGIADILDLWAPLYAFGTQPGMPKWLLTADMANPAALIDGSDIEVVYDNWGYYWYPTSTLP